MDISENSEENETIKRINEIMNSADDN